MAIVEVSYTAGNQQDDAYEETGGPTLTYTDDKLIVAPYYDSSDKTHSAIRFDGVAIPAGSTISSAKLTVTPASGIDDVRADIYLEDADDAVDFVATGSITSRTTTTASTSWSADSLGTSPVDSPDFTAAVQEVIDRGGWASGQAMVVILLAKDTDPALTLQFDGYNGSNSATLTIEYDDGSSEFDADQFLTGMRPHYPHFQPPPYGATSFTLLSDDPPVVFDSDLTVTVPTCYRPPKPFRPTRRLTETLIPYYAPLTTGSPEFEAFYSPVGLRERLAESRFKPRYFRSLTLDGAEPIPESPVSCPGSAVMVKTGPGAAIMTGTAVDTSTYTAIMTKTGPGSAIMEKGC